MKFKMRGKERIGIGVVRCCVEEESEVNGGDFRRESWCVVRD